MVDLHADPMISKPLRVLIIADNPLSRMGLVALLADQPTCQIAGQLTCAGDFLGAPDVYAADVMLWDIDRDIMLDLDEVTTITAVGTPVVVLLPNEVSAREFLRAGVRAVLLRDVDVASLEAALRAAAQGLVVLDAALADTALPEKVHSSEMMAEALTPRELQVLQLLAEGFSNKRVASQLHISEHTVKFHVNAILGKLSAGSRTEAVVRATRLGLIML